MLPWVLLYGVTALLLNHRTVFPDADVQYINQGDLLTTEMASLPTPSELASQLTTTLGAQSQSSPTYEVLNPTAATYGGKMFLSTKGDGKKHSISFDLDEPIGIVQSQHEVPPPAEAFEKKIKLDTDLVQQCERGLTQVLASRGIACDPVKLNFAPKMQFQLAVDGRPFEATYDLRTGTLSAKPLGTPSQLSTRQFLTKLHRAHGYPSRWNAAWVWAVAVDVMFVSMVFWGISGVLMWWQIKRTRLLGAILLVASGGIATALAVGMHQILAH